MRQSAVAAMAGSATQAVARRLLVFVPARRHWSGGARATLSATGALRYVGQMADGTLVQGTAVIGSLPRARAVELVFDVLDVFSTSVSAPRLGEVRLRQALPNLVEERMLGDPADCQFAWSAAAPERGEARGDGAGATQVLHVAAIHRLTLTRALEAFTQAQVEPQAAYSALHVIAPPAPGVVSVLAADGAWLLRTGVDQGCVIEADAAATATLALACQQAGARTLRVYGLADDLLRQGAAAAGVALEVVREPLDLDAVDQAVNLLQGAFATAAGFGATGRWFSRLLRSGAWRAPAAWLAACALVAIAGLNAYWLKLDGQARDLRDTMRHAFRDAFPAEPTIIDETAQARRLVAGLRARTGRPSAEDFSVLNAQAIALMASAPPGIVAGIDYSDAGYALHFKPGTMDGPEQRNALQARAIAQGLVLRFDADGTGRLAPGGQ